MEENKNKANLNLTLKSELIPILIILTAVAISIFSYKLLPEQVITHWNMYGEPDGWSSKNFHAFFFPGLLVFIYLLMNILPKIDPKRQRYQEFFNIYLIIRNLMLSTFLVVFIGATLSNLGYNINIGGLVGATIGVLFIIMGNYLGKIKRNWFVGIKNPWTLSSENVWNNTHRLGEKLFVLWGLSIIALPWLAPQASMWVLLGGALILIGSVTLYSYLLYKQEKKKNNQD